MEDWDWLLDILSKRQDDTKEHERNSMPRGASVSELGSEYEYEYDESETETFYLNVDLNSSGWKGKTLSPRGVEAAPPPSEHLQIAESTDNIQPSQEGASEALSSKIHVDSPSSRSLQILDLHHARPLVNYQNQLFECRWSNIIGTDLLILSSGAPFDGPIAKQGDGYKIIAANSVKLIAQKLTLADKVNIEPVIDGTGEADADATQEEPQVPHGTADMRRNQNTFLKQLATIKKAKGETDKVITASQKAINASGPRKSKTTGQNKAQVWRGTQYPQMYPPYNPNPQPNLRTSDGQHTNSPTPGPSTPTPGEQSLQFEDLMPSIQANNRAAPDPDNEREGTPGSKRQKTLDR